MKTANVVAEGVCGRGRMGLESNWIARSSLSWKCSTRIVGSWLFVSPTPGMLKFWKVGTLSLMHSFQQPVSRLDVCISVMTFSGDGALAFTVRPIGNTEIGSLQHYGKGGWCYVRPN